MTDAHKFRRTQSTTGSFCHMKNMCGDLFHVRPIWFEKDRSFSPCFAQYLSCHVMRVHVNDAHIHRCFAIMEAAWPLLEISRNMERSIRFFCQMNFTAPSKTCFIYMWYILEKRIRNLEMLLHSTFKNTRFCNFGKIALNLSYVNIATISNQNRTRHNRIAPKTCPNRPANTCTRPTLTCSHVQG